MTTRPILVLLGLLSLPGLTCAELPDIRGPVRVRDQITVYPIPERDLQPVPVASPSCSLIDGRTVEILTYDARTAVGRYQVEGFLAPAECDDGALVQLPAMVAARWWNQTTNACTNQPILLGIFVMALVTVVVLFAMTARLEFRAWRVSHSLASIPVQRPPVEPVPLKLPIAGYNPTGERRLER